MIKLAFWYVVGAFITYVITMVLDQWVSDEGDEMPSACTAVALLWPIFWPIFLFMSFRSSE